MNTGVLFHDSRLFVNFTNKINIVFTFIVLLVSYSTGYYTSIAVIVKETFAFFRPFDFL